MRCKGRPIQKYSEEQKIEIKRAYKNSHSQKESNRLLCIKLRVIQGMTTLQISKIVDYAVGTIDKIISVYNREGIDGIKAKKQTGHNRNMTPEQEVAFLEPFKKQAISGEILEVSDIIKAYSAALDNKKVSKSTVYDMLHRNGWRKVMPRSQHPNKADDEAIAAYKKNVWQSERIGKFIQRDED